MSLLQGKNSGIMDFWQPDAKKAYGNIQHRLIGSGVI